MGGDGQREDLGKSSVSDCVMEDMNLLGVEKHVVLDRRMWRAVITCLIPS